MPRRKGKDIEESTVSPTITLYKRLAVGFLSLTAITVAVLLLVTFWSATVTIIPARMPQETTFRLVVSAGAAEVSGTMVPGAIDTALLTATATIPIPATERVEAKAKGLVTITNTTSRAQPLVTTTRLLSAEGILFRLDRQVTVPPKGSVDAAVSADAPGAAGDLPPTTFTIPGLSPELQKAITGSSKDAFHGGITMIGVVGAPDMDNVKRAAVEAAVKQFRDAHPEDKGVTVFDRQTTLTQKVDGKVGEKRPEIAATAQVRITRVRVPTEHIDTVAARVLREQVSDRVRLVSLPLTVQSTLDAVDTTNGRAALAVHVVGASALEAESRALEVAQFLGKSRRTIAAHVQSIPGVANVHVQITPFFMWWTPWLKDHIVVEVKQQ